MEYGIRIINKKTAGCTKVQRFGFTTREEAEKYGEELKIMLGSDCMIKVVEIAE